MGGKYITLNFNNLKPIRIIKTNEKIKKSKYYKYTIEPNPTKDRFANVFNKFLNGEHLFAKDYKILLFYLKDIELENYFNELYDSFVLRIDSFRSYRGFIRPLTLYIYNYYDSSNNIDLVYSLLRTVIQKQKDSEKYKIIKSISYKNNLYREFLNDIKKQFYDIKDGREMEEVFKKVFMTKSDKFYLECMVRFIINNHLNKELIKEFEDAIKIMELKTKKEVFKSILKIYAKESDVDKYPDVWFAMILKYLGDPYIRFNINWNDIEENLKETFRRWNNNKYLYKFFSNVAPGGDRRRLNFWKQYIDSIYQIKYFEELDNALVMEFKDDIFVEFAKEGNALYIYDKRFQNIDNIVRNLDSGKLAKQEKINYLKDRALGDRELHRGYWERDFEYKLKQLNYNKGGW